MAGIHLDNSCVRAPGKSCGENPKRDGVAKNEKGTRTAASEFNLK